MYVNMNFIPELKIFIYLVIQRVQKAKRLNNKYRKLNAERVTGEVFHHRIFYLYTEEGGLC